MFYNILTITNMNEILQWVKVTTKGRRLEHKYIQYNSVEGWYTLSVF